MTPEHPSSPADKVDLIEIDGTEAGDTSKVVPVDSEPLPEVAAPQKALTRAQGKAKFKDYLARRFGPSATAELAKGKSDLIIFPPTELSNGDHKPNGSAVGAPVVLQQAPARPEAEDLPDEEPPISPRIVIARTITIVAAWTVALGSLGIGLRQGNPQPLLGVCIACCYVGLVYLAITLERRLSQQQMRLGTVGQLLVWLPAAAIVAVSSCMYVRPVGGTSIWVINGQTTLEQPVMWSSPLERIDLLAAHQTVAGNFRATTRDGFSVTGQFFVEFELQADHKKLVEFVARTSDVQTTLKRTIENFARTHVQNDLERSDLKLWKGVTGLQLSVRDEEPKQLTEKVPIAWNGFIGIKHPVADLEHAP